ncbi:MAG: radical SAM family heme chaperone HemW [Clostridia bacterium]|nr:radical SAM family heme chaperone HemW [Clostridia bacterium]
MKKSLGIYIHIPFCVQKCRYCDFCSFAGEGDGVKSAYADEIIGRIGAWRGETAGYEADTVYFGGGTPSLMSARDINRILDSINSVFSVSGSAEITLECNPATADGEYFRALRSMGVNRLSMGLQSASDRELALLGRIHTAKDFENTFAQARAAGFDNISADLMYGIPDQDMDSFRATMRYLTALSPEHISAYGLMIEQGTYFEKHAEELRLADDDMQYEMYLACTEYLASCGYGKYEISNFARDGRRSRHNMRYWLGEEYLGFGVAAHSYFGGVRFGNSRDMGAFLRGEDITEERVCLDADDVREEYIMLRLRLSEGIDTRDYACRFGRDFFSDFQVVRDWAKQGFMRILGDRIGFTDKGSFVSNTLLSEMLSLG